jgi:hypothetical protein
MGSVRIRRILAVPRDPSTDLFRAPNFPRGQIRQKRIALVGARYKHIRIQALGSTPDLPREATGNPFDYPRNEMRSETSSQTSGPAVGALRLAHRIPNCDNRIYLNHDKVLKYLTNLYCISGSRLVDPRYHPLLAAPVLRSVSIAHRFRVI